MVKLGEGREKGRAAHVLICGPPPKPPFPIIFLFWKIFIFLEQFFESRISDISAPSYLKSADFAFFCLFFLLGCVGNRWANLCLNGNLI